MLVNYKMSIWRMSRDLNASINQWNIVLCLQTLQL